MSATRMFDRERGVALILVLSVLLALMVIASPFLMVARNESAASTLALARAQARAHAEAAVDSATQRLARGHASRERMRRDQGDSLDIHATPDTDMPEEFALGADLIDERGRPYLDDTGEPLFAHRDARGLTVDLEVRDEHSWPNIASAPPFLIATSLGRSRLSSDITDTDTEIILEDASGFPQKSGHVLIGAEVVSYGERNGNVLTNCQRGLEGGRRASAHKADIWVIDDRAREIAMLPWRSPRAGNGWREPARSTFVKEISLLGRDSLTALEVDRLVQDFAFTGMRFQAGGWGDGTGIVRVIDPASYEGDGFQIRVVSVTGLNPGTVVRITDGVNTDYGMVAETRAGTGFGMIRLFEPPLNAYDIGRTTVSPLLRHPVNINSAPRDVLVRIMTGIQMSLGQGGGGSSTLGQVDEDVAEIVADGIIDSRPIEDLRHFRQILSDLRDAHPLTFTVIQALAIYYNALNPNDDRLTAATVPFTFCSFDRYLIHATAVVNDGSGTELARHEVTERVRVSPPGLVTQSWTTQEDFEEPLFRARSGRWVATHPLPTERWVSSTDIPANRVLRHFMGFGSGSLTPQELQGDEIALTGEGGLYGDPERGDVRLLPARMISSGYNQHFDGPAWGLPDPDIRLEEIDPEGWMLDRGPFEITAGDRSGGGFGGAGQSMAGGGRRRGGGASAALADRNGLLPVKVDLWYRIANQVGGRHVIFDIAGQDRDDDRITLVKESNGELRARVHDRTLDDPGDGFEEVMETVWEPVNGGFWDANTWYHLGLAYRGTRPSDVHLFVDGFRRGRSRFQTQLVSSFDETDTSFSVEEAEDWPDRGVCWVGPEVVAFQRAGNSFDVVTFNGQPWGRGQRGTRVLSHATGAPVSLFGYSSLPRTSRNSSGVVIHAGGATLASTLGPPIVATFAGNDTIPIEIPGPGGQTITIDLEIHDPAKPQGDTLELTGSSDGGINFDCFPQSGGYILIVSNPLPVGQLPPGTTPLSFVQLAYYSSRSGNRLTGYRALSGAEVPHRYASGGSGSGLTIDATVAGSHPISLEGGPQLLSSVYPVSVQLSGSTGYPEPEAAQQAVNSVSFAGTTLSPLENDPEFVQVGLPDTRDLNSNRIEWIRYHKLDDRGNLLCAEERFLLAAALVMRRYMAGGSILGSQTVVNRVLPMRLQCGTNPLSDGNHGGGTDAVPCVRTVSFSRRSAINVPNWTAQQPDSPVNGLEWASAGWGDHVTIEGMGGRDRRTADVAWAGLDTADSVTFDVGGQSVTMEVAGEYEGQGWIAFTRSLGKEYRQRGLPGNGQTNNRSNYCRLLKFPSGELPIIDSNARATVGGDVDGFSADPEGYVDEVRCTPWRAERYILWDHDEMDFPSQGQSTTGAPSGPLGAGLAATSDELGVSQVEWLVSAPRSGGRRQGRGGGSNSFYVLPDGRQIFYDRNPGNLQGNNAGLVVVDEEVIAWRGVGAGSNGAPGLLDCQRGFMASIPDAHGWGADVAFMDWIPVTKLQNAISGTGATLEVANRRNFQSDGGTVLVDGEMMHFTLGSGNTLTMPWFVDPLGGEGAGLFRGRFGTQPSSHDIGAIVLDMPFRYWDRYAPQQDAPELAYWGTSLDLPGLFVHRVEFDEVKRSGLVDIVVLARTEGDIPWTADPATTQGLYMFEVSDDEDPNLINRTGSQLDLRVFFRYLEGACDPLTMEVHDWKDTPELHGISVQYVDTVQVLEREDGQ